MPSHLLYLGLVCLRDCDISEKWPEANSSMTGYLVFMISEMVLISIPFCGITLIQKFHLFPAFRQHLLWCWGFNTAMVNKDFSFWLKWMWPCCVKSITGTAGTPWSCQQMEWSQCCFEELLTWRPGPISMSLWGHIHGRVVWSLVTPALLEKVLITITGHERAARLCQHKIECKTHMEMSINLSPLVKFASPCHRTRTWKWTGGRLLAHLFALDVLLL